MIQLCITVIIISLICVIILLSSEDRFHQTTGCVLGIVILAFTGGFIYTISHFLLKFW